MLRRLACLFLPLAAAAAAQPGASPSPIPNYHEAAAGDAACQRTVGMYYLQMYAKSGIRLHFEDGLSWLRKSARQGNFEAMSDLVRARLDGKAEDRDVAEAREWLEKLHERARVETGYAGRLAVLHASGDLGAVDERKAYFFCLLQRMTGVMTIESGQLQSRLRKTLKSTEVAQAEKDAYDWWEDRNKPARPVLVAGRGNASPDDPDGKKGEGKKEEGGPVDTSEKAQELAAKNRQESARRVKPLGKEGKYTLPGVDDLEKNKK